MRWGGSKANKDRRPLSSDLSLFFFALSSTGLAPAVPEPAGPGRISVQHSARFVGVAIETVYRTLSSALPNIFGSSASLALAELDWFVKNRTNCQSISLTTYLPELPQPAAGSDSSSSSSGAAPGSPQAEVEEVACSSGLPK